MHLIRASLVNHSTPKARTNRLKIPIVMPVTIQTVEVGVLQTLGIFTTSTDNSPCCIKYKDIRHDTHIHTRTMKATKLSMCIGNRVEK